MSSRHTVRFSDCLRVQTARLEPAAGRLAAFGAGDSDAESFPAHNGLEQLGHTYQLQSTNDLVNGPWQNLGSPQTGTGNTLLFAVPIDSAVSRRFFRLQIMR